MAIEKEKKMANDNENEKKKGEYFRVLGGVWRGLFD